MSQMIIASADIHLHFPVSCVSVQANIGDAKIKLNFYVVGKFVKYQ